MPLNIPCSLHLHQMPARYYRGWTRVATVEEFVPQETCEICIFHSAGCCILGKQFHIKICCSTKILQFVKLNCFYSTKQ